MTLDSSVRFGALKLYTVLLYALYLASFTAQAAPAPGALNVQQMQAAAPNAAFTKPAKSTYTLLGRKVDAQEIQDAQNLIKLAQAESRQANMRMMSHPRVANTEHQLKPHRSFLGARSLLQTPEEDHFLGPRDAEVPLPTAADYMPHNQTVKEAAALLAEFSNLGKPKKRAAQATSYWLANTRHGKSPFNPTGGYQVFRNVQTDCGARGDGVTDDTQAIQNCIANQNRCGGNCGSSTVAGAVIYFPPGNYIISTSIQMYYYTQMVGDATQMPTLTASSSFVGLGVLSSDYYFPGGNGAEWYVNQNNFYRQVRNFVIDTRNVPTSQVAGLHWQVAQATSLQNLQFVMSNAQGANSVGIFMENGSGGFFSDITFTNGFIGMQCGNQQFTTRNLVFNNVNTAITQFWDWGWTWKSLTINNANVGLNIIPDQGNLNTAITTFSYVILDSKISANTAILTYPVNNRDSTGFTQLTLDNVDFSSSQTAIKDTSNNVILNGGQHVTSWALGEIVTTSSPSGQAVNGVNLNPSRNPPGGLLGGPQGGYFERAKPQYENVPASSFVNALDHGCHGDGQSDDTACLNSIFSQPGYVFLPAGVYIATDTVRVVSGVKIVGEAWSQIMASGNNFADMNNPRVLLQVGQRGDVGSVEMQDLLFTTKGNTAGAVLVEWNIKASSAGSVAMWDCHFRVGGALGSNLQSGNCPKLTGNINSNCIASSMLLHLTPGSSGYFENVWGWVADHDLDVEAQTQIDIYAGRGALIESTDPVWMYGTAMEHNVFYQYLIHNAANVFMGMIQTEGPYYQSTPAAPAPFGSTVGKFTGDPDFSGCPGGSQTCAMSWGLRVENSQDILVYGAGLYSWFQKYDQGCLNPRNCQDNIVYSSNNSRFFLYNLVTVGTQWMVNAPGTQTNLPATQFANKNAYTSSFNAYLVQAN